MVLQTSLLSGGLRLPLRQRVNTGGSARPCPHETLNELPLKQEERDHQRRCSMRSLALGKSPVHSDNIEA
jgi:hypothetical protein